LQGLRRYHLGRAQVQRARELGEEALQVAQRLADPAALRRAHAALGTCLLYLGELVAARVHLMHGIADNEDQHAWAGATSSELDADILSRTSTGLVLWLLGHPDQALTHTEQMLALARELKVPLVQVSVLSHAAVVHQVRRDVRLVQERAEAAMQLATDGGFSLWMAHARMLHGWALAVQGQGAAGIAQIAGGLAAWRTNDQRLGQPYLLALLADAHRHAGQAEAGLGVLAEALAAVETYGLRMYESELYRLKGELLAMVPGRPRGEAEACFRQAIDLARRQGAKSLELRAALSLGRLWPREGRRKPTRRVLAEIYAGFTEGFDTADLQEARALLHGESTVPSP
jgi:predicted ATPase